MIQGENICLRPVTRDDLELLEKWEHDPSALSEYNYFGMRAPGSLERRFAEDGLLTAWHGDLLVVTPTGEIAGNVDYRRESYGPNEGSIVYNIGIGLIPEHRGKGYGSEAQKLLVAYLFLTYPIMRVEASTDIENIREQRALEKAGFTREGVLRKAQWRGGTWHDMVVYSKLRGE
ncbi:MAG TPA: GNAT family protein [Ktedonosporobacter sp.]|nr:GNAT family protein [Ktedonosporobacter sp.]